MKRIESRPRGQHGRRLYWVWAAMVQRCHNPRARGYKAYGAKGIVVCERWRRSFDAFMEDMGVPASGLSIERIDNAKSYEPGNCRWATRVEQNRNRTNWCRYFDVAGQRVTMREAWERHADKSVTYRAFVKRIVSRGWSIERAISTPARAA